MQFIVKTVVGLSIAIFPLISWSQSTYLPQGNKHQPFLDRLEIRLQRNLQLNVESAKSLNRRTAVNVGEYADSLYKAGALELSKVDQYNLQSLLMNSSEWVQGDKSSFLSRKSLWNTFYKTKANMVEVNEKDFFLAANPVFQGQLSEATDYDGKRIFLNTKGVSVRGMIANRIGFSAYAVDNQERGPQFLQERIASTNAVPGVGFYKRYQQTGVDYFDARGSINFSAVKNYLDFQFGYDKMFIGNGHRSLFLSDFGNSYLFLKISTRIWKFNYTNVWMELTPQTIRINQGNKLLDKKYAAIRHLSLQATPWLNLGLFEAVTFGRKNHFDFTYLNPVIFLRVSEQQNGSSDNAIVGFDFKANVAKKLQFYGQIMVDEFVQKELRAGNGWWGNKFGLQLGGKYINAFRINNLDLQGEVNLVRPFSYTHYDSVANYT
ncbi:MAG TPA: hypothetical protein VM488_01730, partial [Pseudobacter sp.]|nr:hypothetical protein [Pseudobacter sp.]